MPKGFRWFQTSHVVPEGNAVELVNFAEVGSLSNKKVKDILEKMNLSKNITSYLNQNIIEINQLYKKLDKKGKSLCAAIALLLLLHPNMAIENLSNIEEDLAAITQENLQEIERIISFFQPGQDGFLFFIPINNAIKSLEPTLQLDYTKKMTAILDNLNRLREQTSVNITCLTP